MYRNLLLVVCTVVHFAPIATSSNAQRGDGGPFWVHAFLPELKSLQIGHPLNNDIIDLLTIATLRTEVSEQDDALHIVVRDWSLFKANAQAERTRDAEENSSATDIPRNAFEVSSGVLFDGIGIRPEELVVKPVLYRRQLLDPSDGKEQNVSNVTIPQATGKS